MARLLFCGDIVGRSGGEAVLKELPSLIKKYQLDWVVINGENAAAGFGITADISRELLAVGVDAITTGNHIWDQRSIVAYMSQEPRLLRPLNYPPHTPGHGYVLLEKPGVKQLLVINVMGRLFMEPFLDDPFRAVEEVLTRFSLKDSQIGMIVVDFHGETTSEKTAFAHHFDGRVSLVVGTHTHVPTADTRILSKGTGYQTDIGMCGDYDSVIGMTKETAVPKMLKKGLTEKLTPALGPATLSGVIIETDAITGLATSIHPLIIGPHLINRLS